MSIFEKIAFLESFFKLFNIKEKLELKSENEIDLLLENVSSQLSKLNNFNANTQINKMPIFFN
ncbi:MAG: hypothetical protein CL846_09075 [Crocinitomicaceae bacterium]|nr:hypothetical protein [Crocinitomicaceae bacterium]|tara:strand:- start:1606 stop:1794 length:189 start_codon:yes stop_codon:yes gene_type:complete